MTQLQVVNKIDDCWPPGRHQLPGIMVDYLCVHQHGTRLPQWTPAIADIVGLARAHERHPQLIDVTGRLPYHLLVREDGVVEQGIPLRHSGVHARPRWNGLALAIVVLGQFDRHPPPDAQYQVLVKLLAALQGYFTWADIVGHCAPDPFDIYGEILYLPNSSSNPKKLCPGAHLDIKRLRSDVAKFEGQSLDPCEYGLTL